jgi:HEAT repeat protein
VMAELSRQPDAAAKVLAKHFPGPTGFSKMMLTELPEPDELGPIPAALSRLGRAGAQSLATLLHSNDSNVRYFALLTASSLVFPELVDGVFRGLFDSDPEVASAARLTAVALRSLPRFESTMPDLRRELSGFDGRRRALAAEALGRLRDRHSIDGLIALTGSDDRVGAQAAAEALHRITKENFGFDNRKWSRWWAENRSRSRSQWMLSALRHSDLNVRKSAIDELIETFGDAQGYRADAAPESREFAVSTWEHFLSDPARARRLEDATSAAPTE